MEGFAPTRDDLREVKVEEWLSCVFINMDNVNGLLPGPLHGEQCSELLERAFAHSLSPVDARGASLTGFVPGPTRSQVNSPIADSTSSTAIALRRNKISLNDLNTSAPAAAPST